MVIKASKIFLLDKENRFLFYLRDNKPEIPFPEHWDILGGTMEEGETPLQAIKRECFEEIQEVPKNIRFIGMLFVPKGKYNLPGEYENNIFLGEINTPVDRLLKRLINGGEGQDIKYFRPEKLRNIQICPPLYDFMQKNKKILSLI